MKKRLHLFIFLFLFTPFLILHLSWLPVKPVLKKGIWRATVQRADGKEIVFDFDVKDSAGKTVVYVMNAGIVLQMMRHSLCSPGSSQYHASGSLFIV